MTAKVRADGADVANPLATDLDHVLAHTGDIWDEFRDSRLLITGGTGFVGRWLLESLVWAEERYQLGLRAVVLTRDHATLRRICAEPDCPPRDLVGDRRYGLVHASRWRHRLRGARCDRDRRTARHLRSRSQVRFRCPRNPARPGDCAGTAAHGASSLRARARPTAAQPPDVPFLTEEYPGAPDPTDPTTAYGQAKRASEFLCAAAGAAGEIDVVIARCFAFAGPYLPVNSNYAFGNFIRDALAGGPVVIAGDGTARRSYLYTADLSIWLWTLLVKGRSGRIYNVGSDADVSIETLARTIVGIVAPGADVEILGRAQVGTPPSRYVPSIDRARTELGLAPIVPLTEAIERTAAWHRARQTT